MTARVAIPAAPDPQGPSRVYTTLTHASVYTTIIACAAGVVTGAACRDRQLALSLPRELLQDTPPLAAAGLIANSIQLGSKLTRKMHV